MRSRKSTDLVASGALGIVTGVAVVGGLLVALSLPARAAEPAHAAPIVVQDCVCAASPTGAAA